VTALIAGAVLGVIAGAALMTWVARTPPRGGHQSRHVHRDIAAAAAAGGVTLACQGCGHQHAAGSLQHALYLSSRSVADWQALSRGRIGRRLVRRAITRHVARAIWGS
jgi:hypothetical protein